MYGVWRLEVVFVVVVVTLVGLTGAIGIIVVVAVGVGRTRNVLVDTSGDSLLEAGKWAPDGLRPRT